MADKTKQEELNEKYSDFIHWQEIETPDGSQFKKTIELDEAHSIINQQVLQALEKAKESTITIGGRFNPYLGLTIGGNNVVPLSAIEEIEKRYKGE